MPRRLMMQEIAKAPAVDRLSAFRARDKMLALVLQIGGGTGESVEGFAVRLAHCLPHSLTKCPTAKPAKNMPISANHSQFIALTRKQLRRSR